MSVLTVGHIAVKTLMYIKQFYNYHGLLNTNSANQPHGEY